MTIGQGIGGLAGAVGGFLIGGPSGAILGFQIGMGVGSIIDPPSMDEPAQTFQAQDLQFNTFARNLPVPVVYGVNRAAGNILWVGNTFTEVVEREATESGKGAPDPPKVREVWYHADFVMGLSEGEITDVDKVWIDEDEITDREGLDWIKYTGTGSQTADSKVVQALGADAPAFRQVGYLRFTGRLGQANRIPNVTAKISGIKLGVVPVTDFTAQVSSVLSHPSVTLTAPHLRRLVRTADDVLLLGCLVDVASPSERTALFKSLDKGSTWTFEGEISAAAINPFVPDLLLNPDNDDLHTEAGNVDTSGVSDPAYKQFARTGNSWNAVAGTANPLSGIAHSRMTICSLAREPVSGRLWAATMLIPGGGATEPRNVYVQYSDDDGVTWLPSGGILVASFGGAPFDSVSQAPRILYFNNRVYLFWNESIANSAAALRFAYHNIADAPATWSAAATVYATVAARSWDVVESSSGLLFAFAYDAGICRVFELSGAATWTLRSTDSVATGSSDTSRHGYCVLGSGIWEIYPKANTMRARAWTGSAFSDDQQLGGPLAEVVGAASFHGAPPSTHLQYAYVGSPAGQSDRVHFAQSTVTLNRFSNPAKIIKDLLTNARYGLGLGSTRIDDASFTEVEAFCDEAVTNADGTLEKRFELDIVLDNQRSILDHLRDMLATFRGFTVWSQGKVRLRVQKAEAVSQNFDMGSIVADSFQWRKQSYRDRPNVIRVEYINADDDYRHDFVEAFDDWDINQTGERRERTLRLLGIKRTTQAQRMAQYYLDQAIHIVHACTFRVGISALKAEVGDVISVSHDVPGWAAKAFRIWQVEEAENDELTLICLEHNDAIYHDRSIETQASLAAELNAYALPWHVGRLSAYKRRNESLIEAAFTRLQSADNFAGALMYRDRAGAGAFEQLDGTALALAPTAYLDSVVRSVTLIQSGAPAPGAATNSFTDQFSRTSATSLGADWKEEGPANYRIKSHTLWRAEQYNEMVKTDSPVGYWRLGDSSGTLAQDETENSNVGSHIGPVTRGASGLLGDDANLANFFLASSLTAVRVADAAVLNPTSAITLEVLFEANSYPVLDTGLGNFLVKRGLSPNAGPVLRLNSGGQPQFTHGPGPAFTAPTSVLLNTPYHLAGTWDGSFQNIWLNGSLVGSQAHTGAMSADPDPVFIGGHSYGAGNQQFFTGIVDEAAIYGFALNSAQILRHYRAGIGSFDFVTRSGPTSAALAHTAAVSLTDPEVSALMVEAERLGIRPRVGLMGRWQTAGSYGQFYYLDYLTRTVSHSILEIGLFKATSGMVTTLLSAAFVNSGDYFTKPGSPAKFTLAISGTRLEGRLGGALIVSAVDSEITGAGQGGFARIAIAEGYPDVVKADSPVAYWRLGESAGKFGDWAGHDAAREGTLQGSATRAASGLLLQDRDRAVDFQNSGWITTSYQTRVPSKFSLEAWVLPQAVNSGDVQELISKRSYFAATVDDFPVGFALNASGTQLTMHVDSGGDFSADLSFTSSDFAVGTRHHLVGAYDGAEISLFVDGVFHGKSSSKQVIPASNSQFWTLARAAQENGGGVGRNRFLGILDEAAIYDYALSSARVIAHYRAGIGSGDFVRTQGERWDDFTYIASGEGSVNSAILVRGLVDGWAARIFDPSSVLLVGAVASEGIARMTLPVPGGSQPASGFLQVFADQSFSARAPDGRLPSSGFADFRGGDVYDYDRAKAFVSATQSFLPIFHPLGGFANVGSLRVRAEEMGYSTFTDSRLEGVTRGANGSPATSHSNIVSLGAFVVTTGVVGSQSLLDLTVPATDPLSNMPFFASQSGYTYLGASSKFARVGMFLERNAASVVSLHYEYSTGDGAWASLVTSGLIGPTDLTSGLRRSGDILVEPPGDWAPTNRVTSGGATLGDATSRYFLRMLGTTSMAAPPRELEILLDGDLLATSRKGNAFVYEPTLQDSAQALTFKAIAVGIRGQMADGLKAPTTRVWSG